MLRRRAAARRHRPCAGQESRCPARDEPTGALDYQTGKAILALLYDLCKKSRKTVVVVTHNGALAPTADVLIRMKSGKIESFEENPSPVPVQELEW